MSIWDILGIEPTTKTSDIKKAYAKKLKIYHPEDDAEGYQKLREAYDEAIKYSKTHKENSLNNEFDLNNYGEFSSINHMYESKAYEENSYESEQFEDQQYEEIINIDKKDLKENEREALINSLNLNYKNFFKRIEVSTWADIFNNSNLMWNIENSYLLNSIIIDFIKENHFLPKEILSFFDKTFRFTEDKNNLYEVFEKEEIDYLLWILQGSMEVDYRYLCNFTDINYDEFLRNIENATEALNNNNYSKLGYYLNKAEQICKGEPYTCKLFIKYNLEEKHFEDAKEYMRMYSNFRKDDLDVLYYNGLLYFYVENHAEALKIFERLISQGYNSLEFLVKLGTCYFYLKDMTRAEHIFTEVFKRDNGNQIALNYLRLINEQKVKVTTKVKSKRKESFKAVIGLVLVIICIAARIVSNHARIERIKNSELFKNTVQDYTVNNKSNSKAKTIHVTNLEATGIYVAEEYKVDASGKKVKYTHWVNSNAVQSQNLNNKLSQVVLIGDISGSKNVILFPCNSDGSASFNKDCDLNLSEMKYEKALVEQGVKHSQLENREDFNEIQKYYEVD